jgi:hypothetical protein
VIWSNPGCPDTAPGACVPIRPLTTRHAADVSVSRSTGAVKVAGRSVADRIAEAVADGRLIRDTDGRYRLSSDGVVSSLLSSDTPTLSTQGTVSAPCHFLNAALFTIAYGEAQVPYACHACYKIWARPDTLRALFALKNVLKIKVEVLNPVSPNVYLGIVYGGDLGALRRPGQALTFRWRSGAGARIMSDCAAPPTATRSIRH